MTSTPPRRGELIIPQTVSNTPLQEYIYSSRPVSKILSLHASFESSIAGGNPITVSLAAVAARPRHPTVSNTQTRVCCEPRWWLNLKLPLQAEAYRTRVRARDPGCLISGLRVANNNYARLKAAHIFPRAHDVEVCLVMFCGSHKANTDNGYSVGQQRLSEPYHRSCSSPRIGWTHQDWFHPECDFVAKWFAWCMG